jgi:hypothetical protein
MILNNKYIKFLVILVLVIICGTPGVSKSKHKPISFKDDFETGTAKWNIANSFRTKIVDSGDAGHGKVLSLHAGGAGVYALIKGSEKWTDIRIEGDFYFPSYYPHYMGLVYNLNRKGSRVDFGCMCVSGPLGEDIKSTFRNFYRYRQQPPAQFIGNVVIARHHRDGVAARYQAPEYWVVLKDDTGVKPGEWHHFKAEIMGPACHFYVDDMKTPKITYDYYEYASGAVGFKPIFAGAGFWVDNIEVTSIDQFAYKGPILPAGIRYKPETLVTKWHAVGPFYRPLEELEKDGFLPGKTYFNEDEKLKWQPFQADGRGCVVTSRVFSKFNRKYYAYFHTEIMSKAEKQVTLKFSSTNNLVVWVNNKKAGTIGARIFAWYDFLENPEHKGQELKADLKPGKNHVLILVKGGLSEGDGFYMHCGDVQAGDPGK